MSDEIAIQQLKIEMMMQAASFSERMNDLEVPIQVFPVKRSDKVDTIVKAGAVITPSDDPRGDAVGSFVPSTTPDYYLNSYSFFAWKTAAATIEMEPGDILLGPLSFIDWTDIDGYDTTPAVTSTNTHVWLEVRVDSNPATTGSLGAGYAWLKVGSKADMRAALDSTEILTKTVVPLVETVWDAGAITKVKGLQCGDAKLYRSG